MLMEDDEEEGHPECFIPKVVLGSGNFQLLGDLTSYLQRGVVASWQDEESSCFAFPWVGEAA
jgi:hypothetical protein